jgi:transcription-repair coupling factor (superfamily II helicase)
MITLFRDRLERQLTSYPPYRELGKRVRSGILPARVEGTQHGFVPLVIASLHEQTGGASLVLCPTEREAAAVQQDLELVSRSPVLHFPWWGTLPYGEASAPASIFAERAAVLAALLDGGTPIVVAPLRAVLSPLPSPGATASRILSFAPGAALDPADLESRLSSLGYLRVPRVTVHGEFAVRGEVIDVYPAGSAEAVRLLLDFDKVAEIRRFDPLTQSSTGRVSTVVFAPMREAEVCAASLERLAAALTAAGAPPDAAAAAAERLEREPDRGGGEHWYPLLYGEASSILDYLGPKAVTWVVDDERMETTAATIRREYLELYRQAVARKLVVPRPREILLDYAELPGGRRVVFPMIRGGGDGTIDFRCEPPRSFFGNFPYLREEVSNLVKSGYKVSVFAVYEAQADRLKAILKDLPVEILPDALSQGFVLPDIKVCAIQESEIFGRKRRIPRSVQKAPSRAIDSFVDLDPGDYVVHINHGIGRFKGIVRLTALGNERDYIQLEYAEGEVVYVPIEQVNLVQKYISPDSRQVKLDKIGGKSWEGRKKKVKESVSDLADRLVKLYSKRQTEQGFRFPADTDWQAEFEAGFQYQETVDQLRCIDEVKADMEKAQPMDRLVCGDVGYGKTEIALRAAFKAVSAGKQVAVLAPTTILVEQHFDTFTQRFERFPVKIAMLSRFRSRQEQKEITAGLAAGSFDLVIGTHRLLQKDIAFKNLGLIVVDEEQRFGVKDKERLKELKTSVDCLTLTATPIPRTLHMSLMRIRDMSILNTPPANRQPIETFILEFSAEIVTRAIRAELERGGQVYFLHNRVETMPQTHLFLRELMPEVSIEAAHGQMHGEELEEIMRRFVHGEFQVLLSTTIIENGLDIPNVNTIIIDRADMFGVAQLYQLKGRVGRSDAPAYAYLLYPDQRALTELAMKRLRIISDFTELGSGFKIAMKDLEIRGAGNLLGREQSGDILAVGYDMYIRLLDEAIRELGEGGDEAPPEVLLDMEYSGYIPDSYIPEAMEKMEVYKRIASITTREEHDAVYAELEDRFGPLPDEVVSILSMSEVRIICRKLFVSSLRERDGVATVEFAQVSRVPVDRVLRLIRESHGSVYLDSKRPNCLFLRTGSVGLKEKSEFIRDRLSALA